MVFFADEGGSWQVPVDWRAVLPAGLKSLAAVATAGDFAAKITVEVDHHVRYDRDRYLTMTRRIANAPQRKELGHPTVR